MSRIAALFKPPRFLDEEKTRQASLLNIIVWVLIIVPVPFLVYTLLFSPEAWRRVLTQVLSGETVNVFLLLLLRRGYVQSASIIQIATFWAFFTVTAWTGAGVHSQAYQIGQALVICIAGFLIGVQGALIMVGVSLLSGGLMVVGADMGRWSFNPPDKALTVWVVSAVLFPVLAVLQSLAGRLLRTALTQSRMSQAQYRNVVEHIPLRVFIKDLNSAYVSCNTNYARDLGIQPEQIVGKDDYAFYPRDLAERYRSDDRAVTAGEAPKAVEEKYVVSGQELWIHTIKVPYRDHQGHVIGVLGIFEDITDRRQAEEALRHRTLELQRLTETLEERVKERTAELANLSSQLVSAQENERRRVSYDLHDNAWQSLVAVRFEIERLFSDQDGMDRAALQDKAKKVMATILDTVGKIRSMQGDLWPYVLDDIGLLATVDWYCREFEKNHPDLTIEKENRLAEHEIPSSTKIVIYRILQETLSNVAKHSQANHVTLRLVKKDHGMEFTVEDNGIGFDPEETIAKRTPLAGLGLLSIKARTELSGGVFGVESAKGKGTTVRATWRLD